MVAEQTASTPELEPEVCAAREIAEQETESVSNSKEGRERGQEEGLSNGGAATTCSSANRHRDWNE
eukprot:5265922-Amphidinium_carterae.1